VNCNFDWVETVSDALLVVYETSNLNVPVRIVPVDFSYHEFSFTTGETSKNTYKIYTGSYTGGLREIVCKGLGHANCVIYSVKKGNDYQLNGHGLLNYWESMAVKHGSGGGFPLKIPVTEHYIDESGNYLSKNVMPKNPSVALITYNDFYNISNPNIPGYTLKGYKWNNNPTIFGGLTLGNPSGAMRITAKMSIYLLFEPDTSAQVTVTEKHVDITGIPIPGKTDSTATVTKNDPYSNPIPIINGYDIKGFRVGNLSAALVPGTTAYINSVSNNTDVYFVYEEIIVNESDLKKSARLNDESINNGEEAPVPVIKGDKITYEITFSNDKPNVSKANFNLQTTRGSGNLGAVLSVAAIGSVHNIDSADWYVIDKKTVDGANYVMLMLRGILGMNQFGSSNEYEGSTVQTTMTSKYQSNTYPTIKSMAVVPSLGNPASSTSSYSAPSKTLASSTGQTKDIFFAPSYAEMFKFNGNKDAPLISELLFYGEDFWLRTKASGINVWTVSDWVKKIDNTLPYNSFAYSVPAVWVKVSSQYNVTVNYIDKATNQSIQQPTIIPVEEGTTFTHTPTEILKYRYADEWKIGSTGAPSNYTPVSIQNVSANTDIYLYYEIETTIVTDVIPKGLKIISMNPQGSIGGDGRTITWNIDANQTGVIKLTVVTEVEGGDKFDNIATISTWFAKEDPNNTNNTHHELAEVYADVTISKEVKGDLADKTKPFEFIVYIPELTEQTVDCVFSDTSGATSNKTLELDEYGNATVNLKHNESIKLKGISSNANIKITETSASGYTSTYKDSADTSGKDNPNDMQLTPVGEVNRSFEFTNTRDNIVPTGIGGITWKLEIWLIIAIVFIIVNFVVIYLIKKKYIRNKINLV
jgi:hypothetical protein